MKTDIVLMRGGLGNQLFQYCFAESLLLEHSRKVVLNTRTGFTRDRTYGRTWELSNISIIKDDLSTNDLTWRALLRVQMLNNEISKLRLLRKNYHFGLYQDLKLSKTRLNDTRSGFQHLHRMRKNINNGAVLHFRLFSNDYNNTINAPPSYYKKIEKILSSLRAPILTVVSSDPLIADRYLKMHNLFKDLHVKYKSPENPWSDLIFLAEGSYIFGSNSTFSIWAGLIGQYLFGRDSRIVLPSPNQNHQTMPQGWYPENWILL